ncbi:uncharacterized protein LOC144133045 [Amblyomma americanum]
MVLRKSEYRKSFKWFSADKRSALWLENALYRAERRQREYVHEPLGDEMDSGYEVGDSESEECGLPPTRVRQKRLQLAAEAAAAARAIDDDDDASMGVDDGSSCDDRRRRTSPAAAAAAAASRTADVVDARLLAPPGIHVATQTSLPARKDKAVQTVPAEITRLSRINEDHRQRNRTRNRASPRRGPIHCQRCFALWGAPFENFGSGEEVDTIGAKRTFNVAASTNEVHPSALAAMRQRQRSPTPPPLRRKTFRPERPHSAPPEGPAHLDL